MRDDIGRNFVDWETNFGGKFQRSGMLGEFDKHSISVPFVRFGFRHSRVHDVSMGVGFMLMYLLQTRSRVANPT